MRRRERGKAQRMEDITRVSIRPSRGEPDTHGRSTVIGLKVTTDSFTEGNPSGTDSSSFVFSSGLCQLTEQVVTKKDLRNKSF